MASLSSHMPQIQKSMSADEQNYIKQEPLAHEDELCQEGATIHEFEATRDGTWHDMSGRSVFEVLELSERTEDGSLKLEPGAYTQTLEFTVHAPKGLATECTCNSCWNRFWIAPFREPTECPYCHERGSNIASQRVIGGE